MTRINFYSLKMVKESSGTYDVKAISSPASAYKLAVEAFELNEAAEERFCIIVLNTKNKPVGLHTISTGTLNASLVHPREVFKAAMLNNAFGLILVHNHPSGDPEPSKDDIETNSRLIEAGKILGINVLDHIIVGDERYISLKERGLM